jgi:hypothetical protein
VDTWVVFAAPCCTFRSGCLRPFLLKPFRRVYLVSSLIFVDTAVFFEELTSVFSLLTNSLQWSQDLLPFLFQTAGLHASTFFKLFA